MMPTASPMDALADGAFKLPSVPEFKASAATLQFSVADTSETKKHAKHVSEKNASGTLRHGSWATPSWCISPPANQYTFSVIKNGTVIETIKLEGKTRFMVGRRSDYATVKCDIAANHQSCSRSHAVLFYGEKPSDAGAGFYLVDLNSTHGTFVNKIKLLPEKFYRLDCGYVIKFGESTRILVLEGPPSADISLDPGLITNQPTAAENSSQQNSAVTWGLTDDDDNRRSSKRYLSNDAGGPANDDAGGTAEPEAEGERLITDPVELEERAAYYREDPKAILTKWFDVMGYEMHVDVDEQNTGTKAAKFTATLELPYENFDGTPLTATAVSIRQKEAIHQACLEACRLLDIRRALRETIQNGPVGGGESERVRKANRLAANDYYDDEEDEFFDRTGELQSKRMRRMQRDAAAAAGVQHGGGKPETFESLQLKLQEAEREIAELNAKLERNDQLSKPETADDAKTSSTVDALDAFIAGLRQGILLDPKEKSKTKQRLVLLRNDKIKLEKLVELTRATLPLLAKVQFISPPSSSDADAVVNKNSVQTSEAESSNDVAVSADDSASEAVQNKVLLPQKPAAASISSRKVASVFGDAAKVAEQSILLQPSLHSTQVAPAPGSSSGLMHRFQKKVEKLKSRCPNLVCAPPTYTTERSKRCTRSLRELCRWLQILRS